MFEIYRAIFIDTSCKKKKSDQLCRKVKGDKNVHTRFTNVMTVEQHEKIVYTKMIQPFELKKACFSLQNRHRFYVGFQTTLTKRILTKLTRTRCTKTIKMFKNSQPVTFTIA